MKRKYILNLLFLSGMVFATSCKTSQSSSSKPPTKPATSTVTPVTNQTGPQYVPWRQKLIDSWAHMSHEKPDIAVVNSDEIILWDKSEAKTEVISNAIAKNSQEFTVTIPAKTVGKITEFMEVNSTSYLRVVFTLKDNTPVTVFFREQTDGTYTLCVNEPITRMNAAFAVYKGTNLSLTIQEDQQKKCILMVNVATNTTRTKIGG